MPAILIERLFDGFASDSFSRGLAGDRFDRCGIHGLAGGNSGTW